MFSLFLLIATVLAEDASVTGTSAEATSTPLTPENLAKMTLVERLKAYPWSLERWTVGAIAAYLIIFYFGAKYNKAKVDKFVDSLLPVLKGNFFQVGVADGQLLAQDDYQHFSLYATGRVNIESVTAKFDLQARQNFPMWSSEWIVSFFTSVVPTPEDTAKFAFKIDSEASAQIDDFTWAVVTKDNMNNYRKDNYYLSLTKTSESDKLPIEYVFMNEVSEMNEKLYTEKLSELLEKCKSFLQFIVITDQPALKPDSIEELESSIGERLVVQMKMPGSDDERATATELITYLLDEYIDFVVANGTFRSELTRRCKKTREVEVAKLKKAAEDRRREEQDLAKREVEKQKIDKLTPAEQEKLAKRREERRQRKQMKRVRA